MTYPTTLKPTQSTEQDSTCESCRYFSDFRDKQGRGWCRVFDHCARKHHRKTETCSTSIRTLEREEQPAFVFWVKLISKQEEDDGYGYAVPVDEKMVQVVVSKPTRELVETEIASMDHLRDYCLVDFWQPQGGFEI